MRRLRRWSVHNARWLKTLYLGIERGLVFAHPLIKAIGYRRADKPVLAIEKLAKGLLFDSRSCGQCVLGSTGMSCPMNCPKRMRNGPCGGVRPGGKCEVDESMDCVWVLAWQGNRRLREKEYPIQVVQVPVDNRLYETSAWLREVRRKTGSGEIVG